MSTTYRPDSWVIVEIFDPSETATGPLYKVLGGWSGGYLDGSSWRLNSGITRVETRNSPGDFDRENNTSYLFHGYSGSVYTCKHQSYGLRMSNAGAAKTLSDLGCKILSLEEALEVIDSLSVI